MNVYKPDYSSIFQTSCKHTADTLLVSVINTFGVTFFLSILKVFVHCLEDREITQKQPLSLFIVSIEMKDKIKSIAVFLFADKLINMTETFLQHVVWCASAEQSINILYRSLNGHMVPGCPSIPPR